MLVPDTGEHYCPNRLFFFSTRFRLTIQHRMKFPGICCQPAPLSIQWQLPQGLHPFSKKIRRHQTERLALIIPSQLFSLGYGDIVPVTFAGKVCTILYAMYGIPIFIWYIVKLGALFRVLVMRLINGIAIYAR